MCLYIKKDSPLKLEAIKRLKQSGKISLIQGRLINNHSL